MRTKNRFPPLSTEWFYELNQRYPLRARVEHELASDASITLLAVACARAGVSHEKASAEARAYNQEVADAARAQRRAERIAAGLLPLW